MKFRYRLVIAVFVLGAFLQCARALQWGGEGGVASMILPWTTTTTESATVSSHTFTSSGFTPSWPISKFYSSMFGQSVGLSATISFFRSALSEGFSLTSPTGASFTWITKSPISTGFTTGNASGVGGQVSSNALNVAGSVGYAGAWVQGSTLAANFFFYRVDSATGPCTVTFPAPDIITDSTFGGRQYRIMKADSSTNTVTVVGSTTTVLTYQGESVDYWREWTGPGAGSWWPMARFQANESPSKTKAQLTAYAPPRVGLRFYCSDCTTDGDVISTGTAAGAFGRISAKSTAIN